MDKCIRHVVELRQKNSVFLGQKKSTLNRRVLGWAKVIWSDKSNVEVLLK